MIKKWNKYKYKYKKWVLAKKKMIIYYMLIKMKLKVITMI